MADRELSCSCKNVDPFMIQAIEDGINRIIRPGSSEGDEMHSRLAKLASGCGFEPDPKGGWTQFPKQEHVLDKLGKYDIVEEHSDGDLTVRSQGKLYVVTTEGKIFEEK